MNIKSIGGEFGLIQMIRRKPKRKSVVLGIGDDAAIVRVGGRKLVLTTDLLVENDHFSLKWATPKQIGIKAMEVNVSDVAAMNAKPLYALVSVCLRRDNSVEFVKDLYDGIYAVAKKYGIDVVGGDFTHGARVCINVAIVGGLAGRACLRSKAKPGDAIFVSGSLGHSAAGLNLLLRNKKGFSAIKKRHLEPRAQLGKALRIGKIANAMEDVSDGLASEVRNICHESKCGAEVFVDAIPISSETRKAAKAVGKKPANFALFGGEDFELVFTVSRRNLDKAKKLGKLVGKVTRGKKIYLVRGCEKKLLKKTGFDHFA